MSNSRSSRLLPLVLALTSVGVLNFAILIPALPEMADALNVSRSVIGVIQGAAAFPGVVLAVFIGHIADLRGRRFVAVWALLLYGISGIFGFWVNSFWVLVATRIVQGAGAAAILGLAVMIIGDSYSEIHERRRALGINAAVLTSTAVLSPVLGGFLASGGVNRPFLAFGIALPLAWFARKFPGHEAMKDPGPIFGHIKAMFVSLTQRERISDFLGLLPFTAVTTLLLNGAGFTATPIFLEEVFDIDTVGRGIIQSFPAVGSVIASLLSASLVRRHGPTFVLRGAFIFVTFGFIVVANAPIVGFVPLGLIIVGLGFGTLFPLLSEFATSAPGNSHRGVAVAIWMASLRLGQTVGPVFGTILVTQMGGRFLYWLTAIVFVFILFAWIPLRRMAQNWAIRRKPLEGRGESFFS